MFCKYCGRQVKEGEECICRKAPNSDSVKMQAPGKRQQIPKTPVPKAPVPKTPVQKTVPKQAQPRRPKPVPKQVQPRRVQPEQEPQNTENKKGLAVLSFVCTAVMLLSFLLLRFVFQDALSGSVLEEIYPYMIYIIPLIFGIAALLLAVLSMQDKKIRKLSLAGILASVIIMAGIFVFMAVLPYEAPSYSSYDEDDEKDNREDPKRSEEVEGQDTEAKDGAAVPSDSGLAEIKKDYEDKKADYAQTRNALNALDWDAMKEEDRLAALDLQETMEKDLEEDMKTLAAASDYKKIMENLSDMRDSVENEDEFISGLLEKYEPEYIMYLDQESKKLAEEGNKDAAVKMLEEAQGLVQDKDAVMELLMETQNAVGAGDYIIADSNSRYLTAADISSLTIQQVNYAKNEIYARHGRRFQSNELQNYFDSKTWYQGTIEPSAFNVNVLNAYEKKNAELLSNREFSMESGGYKLDVQ